MLKPLATPAIAYAEVGWDTVFLQRTGDKMMASGRREMPNPASPNCLAAFLLYSLAGVFIWIAVTAPDEQVHAPRWVIVAMGLGFLFMAFGATVSSKAKMAQKCFHTLFWIAFLTPFHWLIVAKPNLPLIALVGYFDYALLRHFWFSALVHQDPQPSGQSRED